MGGTLRQKEYACIFTVLHRGHIFAVQQHINPFGGKGPYGTVVDTACILPVCRAADPLPRLKRQQFLVTVIDSFDKRRQVNRHLDTRIGRYGVICHHAGKNGVLSALLCHRFGNQFVICRVIGQ